MVKKFEDVPKEILARALYTTREAVAVNAQSKGNVRFPRIHNPCCGSMENVYSPSWISVKRPSFPAYGRAAFVPKMMGVESVRAAGRRSRSRALFKRVHCVTTWSGVCRSVCPHWQSWGSGARGRCLALYSHVKACSLRRHMAVQKTGQAKLLILVMNSGAWPEGGW